MLSGLNQMLARFEFLEIGSTFYSDKPSMIFVCMKLIMVVRCFRI